MWRRGVGGWGGYEDAAPKDMAFLPLCKHVDTQICRVKRMLSHIPALSLSLFLSLMDTITITYTQKKKRSGSAPSLSGRRP